MALVLVMAGCGDDATSPPDAGVVAAVLVDAPRTVLAVGDTVQLSAVALNSDGDTLQAQPAAWTSAEPGVLGVDAAGRVVVHQAGTAQVSAAVDGVESSITLTGVALEFESVVAGDGVTCGLTSAGQAWCWGNVGTGGFGGGVGPLARAPLPRLADASLRFRNISLRIGGGCGALLDGTASCWGTNDRFQVGATTAGAVARPVQVQGIFDVESVAAGSSHACARLHSGQVWCWGRGDAGQLGDGWWPYAQAATPVAGLFDAVELGVGSRHSCARRAAGAVACWGDGTYGQLGPGISYIEPAPVQVPGLLARSLALNWAKGCALDLDHHAACWGHDGHTSPSPSGPLPTGPDDLLGYTPTPIGWPPLVSITAGPWHACGLTASGDGWCWGANEDGQLGNGTLVSRSFPVPVGGGHVFQQVGAGNRFTCGLDTDGAAWCWGHTADGRLGRGISGGTSRVGTPSKVVGSLVFRELGVGEDHACGLTVSGEAWCWGSNEVGQVGDGQVAWPSALGPVKVGGEHLFATLHVGSHHGTCAIEATGQAWCWGHLPAGDGSPVGSHPLPVPVGGGHSFSSITPGFSLVCGLDVASSTWCWGKNDEGQLGTGGTDDAWTPVAAGVGHTFVEVAAGAFHACGRTVDGATWCWGQGKLGALGTGIRPQSPVPVAVNGVMAARLAVGGTVTCGTGTAGTSCWGTGGPSGSPLPGFAQVSIGAHHGCGVLPDDGRAQCWGVNSAGQLGSGSLGGFSAAPVTVSGGISFRSVTVGESHSCGTSTEGTVWCWGSNQGGELGAGMPPGISGVGTPVKVLGQ